MVLQKFQGVYVVHHDIENGILQLDEEKIHKEFTHIGGYSIF